MRIDRLKDAIRFIDRVYNYLTVKRPFAEMVKRFCEYRLSVDVQKRDENGKFTGYTPHKTTMGDKDINFFEECRALRDASETKCQTPYKF